ncbi:chorismate mutase [Bacillus sp. 165]|uniref:chorismate mutase n=1 Tax=Bacillus sp. 165 TaxID=1529117 RepID=UPI001ADB093A|nr:chorismate mutase [Bacillus sp. 165]MBO9128240.1 chorismate mutase [Bacillus sp. 165]
MIRGFRGATTVQRNEQEEILEATEELLRELARKNKVEPHYITSVLISATEDIDACFPAAALRNIEGWQYVPVICMKEIKVPNSLQKCIRVMMTAETDLKQKEIEHIYLKNAVQLRPDLQKN